MKRFIVRFTGECVRQITSIKYVARLSTAIVFVMLWAVFPAQAQQAEWERLIQEIQSLQQQGHYPEAMVSAKQALKIVEKARGPEHPNVATTLLILADLYRTKGQYAEAEPLYQRSLAIREKALGPDHPDVAWSLNNLSSLYYHQSRYAQAEPLFKRSLVITEKALGADHPDVGMALNNLAVLYRTQGRYAQAEPLYQRALAIQEKALGPNHPDVGMALNNLAALFVGQSQYAQAEPLYRRALTIQEKALGPDHPAVGVTLNNLAALFAGQSQYAQAEPLYQRSLAIQEKALGPNHPAVATTLDDLAEQYRTLGQYTQAEPLYQRALAIKEKALGGDHPNVGTALNNLAVLYRTQGRHAQAEPLYQRALAIQEKAFGPNHPAVAATLGNLAGLYSNQGQYAEAEPLYQRSLAILEKAHGADHPAVAGTLGNLAGLYSAQGRYAQAEPLYQRALTIWEKALGPGHPDVATTLSNFARLYSIQGQYAKAHPLYLRALAINQQALGPDHPVVATILNNFAVLYVREGLIREALSMARKATAIYRQRIVAGGTGHSAIQEASKNRLGFHNHLALLPMNPDKEPSDKITDEAFQIVQLEQASGTASAIAKMASRFASGDDALASLIKRKQDASDRRTKAEARLVAAASKAPQERKAGDEQGLRDDITRAGKEIDFIDAELTRSFPDYQELTRPEPLAVGQIQALLRPGEAMLIYALGGEDLGFFWVVRQESVEFFGRPVDLKKLAGQIAAVRSGMEFDGEGNTSRVSVDTLHELYQTLFAPALPYLAGVRHIMVVPAGPLQSLPFSMLVASPPPTIKSNADYRQVDWLAKHYALSVLPSVSSIQAFRQFAKAGSSQEPFAGFGDPLIGGSSDITRGKRAKMDVARVFRNLVANANARGNAGNQAAEIADVEAIRQAPRLPETADELRAMASALKSDQKSLWLQEKATETRIKHLDLSMYQTIAFATHGVMAGEVKGIGEAGLILTPPPLGSVEDDGYLSASEIAKLKLNADWVVLSACNTAAADGTPGAEGLSGLAKAFFYAGARSLFVSHWPVASEATVPLTTVMLTEYEANPAQGKAEAHRKAMIALMATPDHPEYAHPAFWAPFVVVGEGGTGRPAR